ncbi:uncharacterized protein LOC108903643 [Anoplophora glabripennis]|uniref:uncharacterized protein LOC108903643 n=1 Tax=Anoplophora glabripennis TaxID=217634 RepID=UPI0008748070|nr:uncharacterized protein LOC108903643 [Anoplophora glabripennis]
MLENDFDNYLPKYDDAISYQYSPNNFEDDDSMLKVTVKAEDVAEENIANINNEVQEETTIVSILDVENATSLSNNSETVENVPFSVHEMNRSFDDIRPFESSNKSNEENESNRLPRQEFNETINDPEFESQEEGSSEEEGNMVTGLISAFLGGLSRPDGSIDLEAIVGLLGSLSTQNDDGSYDFQGLTDLLRGFFGGGGDEGGGSDIGSFLGGLLGAVIKGVANPPGAKGAGIFTGKVITGILPALSGPPPADDMDMAMNKPQGLDSGGFLSGLLKTILNSSGGGNDQGGGGGSNLFKVIFQLITSVLSASSKSH